ncbi:MAG TPA: ATP-binding protein [Burkholderiaceae bacterium]
MAATDVDPLAALLHELDTPLGVTLTAVSVQAERLDTLTARFAPHNDPDLESLMSDLRESAQLARKGLDRAIAILGARRAARNAQLPAPADPLSLEVVLGDALSVPMVRFGDRIAECSLQVEGDLLVQTEPNAWYQVISNLVANSALHGFVGREQGGRISVSAGPLDAGRVRVQYRDDGRGFSAHARAGAFTRRYSSRAGGGSSGLGLCIIRDIVRDRLFGTIELLAGTEGTAFDIDFPTRPPAVPMASAP